MYSLCKGMKWNHLPVAGGIYEQHPTLIDRFYYIMAEESKHEAAEAKKKEAEQNAKMGRRGRKR